MVSESAEWIFQIMSKVFSTQASIGICSRLINCRDVVILLFPSTDLQFFAIDICTELMTFQTGGFDLASQKPLLLHIRNILTKYKKTQALQTVYTSHHQ